MAESFFEKDQILEEDLEYVAAVFDGEGHFDIRTKKNGEPILKSICLKMSTRDMNVLARVKSILNCGSVKSDIKFSTYHISTKVDMRRVVELLNGRIRLRLDSFMDSCKYLNIQFKQANYVIPRNSTYLSGLIDTRGSVVFHYRRNIIILALVLKLNSRSEKLNFDITIPGIHPKVYKLQKGTQGKDLYGIRFVFCPTIDSMIHVYNFIVNSRNYSDVKYYRLLQIKNFIEIRNFKDSIKGSEDNKTYCKWVLNFISYLNPDYRKVNYFKELTL
jgi:hypothetical protein